MKSFSNASRAFTRVEHTWVIESFNLSKDCIEINGLKSNQFAAPGKCYQQFYIELNSYVGHLRIGNIAISKEAISREADYYCEILYNDLYKEPNKILPSHTLKIRCEVTIFNAPATTKQLLLNVPKPNILNDLSAFLNSGEFADVKIVTGDGNKIPAHMLILSARSKVFAAMFKHPLKENQQNCVNISDYSYEVVLEMLRFIYTGCASNLKDMTAELLSAADKYDLGRLKAMCLNFLAENLGVENAATTLKLADLYHEEELKSYVLEYIKNNRASVLKSSSWKSLATTDKILVLESFCLLKLDE